ncbi:MAG TPA: 2-oxo acid dehydrogenase subunit E2 [Candidatus Poseidoniales archaeon]|jgi:2-oxoisovalerate dehydrogenase E2 component (dihydrolipoyl transacylase)|nr:MAG: branched-chain alpha-keto acid dehydrogenase subunit E2 [Euryarchaeota archaeon]HIG03849.1 2-oxo acid dehydrogenase subunit E2 [Candidatus Poseidoniales archaeon]HIK78288.1 2-oxo acid dehydrogenase subunit E2 [Candidatus Poseidoniales archaeon]
MGIYAFKLPDIGEGVIEGEVVEWKVAVGDDLKEDDLILSVMTDKATVEIPSPVEGKVTMISGKVGDIIAVGSVCIEFEVDGDGNASASSAGTKAATTDDAPAPVTEPAVEDTPASVAPLSNRAPETKAMASPAVRRSALEAGVDLDQVVGSGPAGRITRADLAAWIANPVASASSDVSAPATSSSSSVSTPSSTSSVAKVAKTGVTEIPVIGLRRKIAEQMVKSVTTIPHFSYFEEVDVTELESLRQHLNANRSADQPKLTYLPFIMQGLVKALADNPICNAIYDDEAGKVFRHEAVHLGIATQTERGLYVPVVKHVEAMDVWASAAEMMRVSDAAKKGTASIADLSGSTFTITSLGRMGGLGATPIINKPEVGILGVHKAVETPVVIDGRIEVRRIMRLSSSWDHRVVDGWDGAMLVQSLKKYLEHPATIFM